jgi:UDP-N-acetylglucosamine--N-acetylmuramyl-(pentapeptide) pyrophosphoryl-undecaprenol N-acetylglucosamine transferase
VIGGSQGAEKINDTIIDALPELLSRYQIIHQTGALNINDVMARSKLVMENSPNISRFVPISFMNMLTTRKAAGCATLIISRAGSAIFEIASCGIPSIIIPITKSNGDHQRKNAFNYARTGACEVIEESNLTTHVLIADIDDLINNKEKLANMKAKALSFASPLAASKIAQVALDIATSHE